LILVAIITLMFSSCKPTFYSGFNNFHTNVELTKSNFKTLGSFYGTATEMKNRVSIENDLGLIARAKEDLLEKAARKGAYLTGSRTLSNVTIERTENKNRIVVTISAEIIEFLKSDEELAKEAERKEIAKEVEQRKSEEMKNSKCNDSRCRNGQKPTHYFTLNSYNNVKFYVYSDDVIMYYNTQTKEFYECAQKRVPTYKNTREKAWAWSFSISNLSYLVSTNEEVWVETTNGSFHQCGNIKPVDF